MLWMEPGCSFLFSTHFCIIKVDILLFEEHAPQKEKNVSIGRASSLYRVPYSCSPKKLEVEEHALERLTFSKVLSISILYFELSEYYKDDYVFAYK